jgi:1-phosphofructokinase
MILTFTANPSIDRTVEIDSMIERGQVHRATRVSEQPGGKGVNVSRALSLAGAATVAVLPADTEDPLVRALLAAGIRPDNVPTGVACRLNITVTEPDGTTTKFNDPGKPLTQQVTDELGASMLRHGPRAGWAVLSGSLPPGAPTDWYARLTPSLQALGCLVAVDTSGQPLLEVVGSAKKPDLLKPNAAELGSVTGFSETEIENDIETAVRAAGELIGSGVGAVLATLGPSGAVLVTDKEAWLARPPSIQPRSTVGAGDASLAGYVLAHFQGAPPADCLRMAVAYGAAAAALAGSTMPAPADLRRDDIDVSRLDVPDRQGGAPRPPAHPTPASRQIV